MVNLNRACALAACLATGGLTVGLVAAGPTEDFGAFVQSQLRAHSQQLFGFVHPLDESSPGPYTGASVNALVVAQGLKVTLVSSAVHNSTDQIALWPDDEHPTHLFVCSEESADVAVERVDLSQPAGSNATVIVKGLEACDPVRRTPWGTIIVAEEAGATGGLYELIDPVHINSLIEVTNRDTGATTDPLHLVKRQAVGSLSFESFAIKDDGTMIYGDELAPSGGKAGGGIYKFVPSIPYGGGAPIQVPAQSPFASGTIYGLHVARNNNSSNWGQGAETGKGRWTAVNTTLAGVLQADGDIILETAQLTQLFTGFYRPEDMDIDPIAAENGVFRACWANTGRMSHGFGSLTETGAVNAEIMCLIEDVSAAAPTGTTPVVSRFVPGAPGRQMYDNVAFQPHTGNLVILEDGPVNVVTPTGTETRGNDLWICLPDGADDDTQTDGCVRFGNVRDTTAEPTGFIFLGSGEEAFVSIQHRGVDEAAGTGSLMKISGFKIH